MRENIIITGFMGTGKSVVAKELARKLKKTDSQNKRQNTLSNPVRLKRNSKNEARQ
ncbi:MAG: DUF2075 domain-containing protein [Acidobacteria bacterium]|nr:DUF2075 domain-containing protein [Acidobacteriota bacterium]